MNLIRTVELSIWDLASHAFRSFLTGLGVVFGVGAVVAMMAVSEGASREALRQIEARGIDNIVIRSVRPSTDQSTENASTWNAASYGVTLDDMRHIRHDFDNVRSIVPVRRLRMSVYNKGKRSDIQVFATIPEFLQLSNSRVADPRGRFITDSDGENAVKACAIGIRAARTLFGFNDPLGQNVNIDGKYYHIVGLFENPFGSQMMGGYDLDNVIITHIEAANTLHGKMSTERKAGSFERVIVEADFLYIRVGDQEQIENTAGRLRTYLEKTHPQNDYEVQVPYELLKQREASQRISTIVMASIAAISLLVGGIGIMNIMMANIYERTKEIGTRRAVGAKKRDILTQFLVEAVVLTSLGGVLGVGLGVGLAEIVAIYAKMETVVTPISVIVSFGVSVCVGVIFGTYPAWKAANLDPITALRTE